MIVLSEETEELARRLAELQHIPVDAAVREALEARARAAGIMAETQVARRDQSSAAAADRRAKLRQLVAGLATLPVIDPRPPRAILDDLNSL